VDRQPIDKFGNPLDGDKAYDTAGSQGLKPECGEDQREKELEDDDDWSKKLKELQMLRAKRDKGEHMT